MTEWLSSSPAPEDPERITADIRRVLDMFWAALPPHAVMVGTDDKMKWEWVGRAMLAKAATTAESMLLLLPERRALDAFALLRVLFENVVMFSYVAINPELWLRKMWATFYRDQLKEHNDFLESGLPLVTDDEMADIRRWLEATWPREHHQNLTMSLDKHALPPVPHMAAYADGYWAPKFDGWYADVRIDEDHRAAISSLRGLYRFIYRRGSHSTHTRYRALDVFLTYQEGDEVTVHRESAPESLLVWNLALTMLVFMSGPAEERLGIRSYQAARAVLATYDLAHAE